MMLNGFTHFVPSGPIICYEKLGPDKFTIIDFKGTHTVYVIDGIAFIKDRNLNMR